MKGKLPLIHHSSFVIHHCFLMYIPRAKKRLGQNFLVDESYARRIVAALAPRAGETVVEIGPGRGALTALLLGRGGRVGGGVRPGTRGASAGGVRGGGGV